MFQGMYRHGFLRSPEQKHHQILLGVHQDIEEKPTEQGQTEKGEHIFIND